MENMRDFEQEFHGPEDDSFDDKLLGLQLPTKNEAEVIHQALMRQIASGGSLAHAGSVLSQSPELEHIFLDLIEVYGSNPANDKDSLARGILVTLETLGQLETHRQQNGE